MQHKGLLYAGYDGNIRNAFGKECGGCGSIIKTDHFHKSGVPYHKECR